MERISRLATALLGVPVSLVSLVEEDRQVFAAQVGLAEPWAGRGETPLSHSFCQHVVADDSALVVGDARRDARLHDNRAIEDLGVVAYCGVPLRTQDGHVLGSFCVIDSDPREWTPEEVALVEDLGALAQTELARQAADADRAIAHDVRSTLHGVVGGARTLARTAGLDGEVREQLVGVVERQARHLEELIFQWGHRASSAPGRGLGLATVRELARTMGGDVSVTSEPGRGTTFELALRTGQAAPPVGSAASR